MQKAWIQSELQSLRAKQVELSEELVGLKARLEDAEATFSQMKIKVGMMNVADASNLALAAEVREANFRRRQEGLETQRTLIDACMLGDVEECESSLQRVVARIASLEAELAAM